MSMANRTLVHILSIWLITTPSSFVCSVYQWNIWAGFSSISLLASSTFDWLSCGPLQEHFVNDSWCLTCSFIFGKRPLLVNKGYLCYLHISWSRVTCIFVTSFHLAINRKHVLRTCNRHGVIAMTKFLLSWLNFDVVTSISHKIKYGTWQDTPHAHTPSCLSCMLQHWRFAAFSTSLYSNSNNMRAESNVRWAIFNYMACCRSQRMAADIESICAYENTLTLQHLILPHVPYFF